MLYFEGINNLINAETEKSKDNCKQTCQWKTLKYVLSWRKRILENLAIIDAHIELLMILMKLTQRHYFQVSKK